MKANEQGNFRPSDSVTRAEMAAIISRWLGLEVTEDGTSFTDVSSNHWAFLAIEQVKQAGIMNGYNDGTFKPSNALTRAEAVTIINRIIGLEPVSNLDASSFSDVSIKHLALGDIEAAASNKE